MTRASDVYIRFLQLAETLRALPDIGLDPLEERLLQTIAGRTRAGEELSVRSVIAQSSLGSPATLHSRLTSMREKGWIRLGDTEDTRRKSVELTPKAIKHFDQLGKALAKASAAP